ncbi:hypothetical protein GCM10022198_23170 [Klugiella xanthotipulae]|uniref:Putative membrane protein n=1 Tax=Klugiella xanthotipulae TaxID=244735 RepID=A0A543I5T3_9MICO|nr:DMT family transporter [Klugiella xanthotipulae]TQM65955.1 putative membrane protein [Klugiella xanthotipulae]
MITPLIGLVTAAVYGSADFFGGLAAQRRNPVYVSTVAALAGGLILLLATLVIPGTISAAAIGWGMLGGVAGSLGLTLLYGSLAVGPMSILSPITAVMSAVVPMTVGLVRGSTLSTAGYLGLGLALVAVVLVGFIPEKGAVRPRLRGLLMAVGSGSCIGIFYVFINQTPHEAGLIPVATGRLTNAAIMCVVVAVLLLRSRRRRAHGKGVVTEGEPRPRPWVRLALLAGVIDAVGSSLFLLGIRTGDLSVMSVLTALYPAGTILLAALVLRERVAPVQWGGLALGLVAAVLLGQ